jgi:hypothetical protein
VPSKSTRGQGSEAPGAVEVTPLPEEGWHAPDRGPEQAARDGVMGACPKTDVSAADGLLGAPAL